MSHANEEYKKILEDRMKKIQNKLNDLRKRDAKIDIIGHRDTKIKALEVEYEALKQEVEDYLNRDRMMDSFESTLSVLDKAYDKRDSKEKNYNNQIEELEALKKNLQSNRAKKRIDRKIDRIKYKVKKLQKKKGFVGKVQRTIMYPKYRRDLKRQQLLSHATGRVVSYEEKIKDNEALKEMFDPNKTIDTIKERFYDIRGHFYKKRLDRSKEILAEMMEKNNIVSMYGARVTSLGKNRIEQIRNNNQNTNLNIATI